MRLYSSARASSGGLFFVPYGLNNHFRFLFFSVLGVALFGIMLSNGSILECRFIRYEVIGLFG